MVFIPQSSQSALSMVLPRDQFQLIILASHPLLKLYKNIRLQKITCGQRYIGLYAFTNSKRLVQTKTSFKLSSYSCSEIRPCYCLLSKTESMYLVTNVFLSQSTFMVVIVGFCKFKHAKLIILQMSCFVFFSLLSFFQEQNFEFYFCNKSAVQRRLCCLGVSHSSFLHTPW